MGFYGRTDDLRWLLDLAKGVWFRAGTVIGRREIGKSDLIKVAGR